MEAMDEIEVRSVYAEDDGEVFIIAFETVAHEGAILQLSHGIGEQDSMLGMDSYSFTVGDATVYGGVVDATLDQLVLGLSLTQAAAEALGVASEMRLRLSDEAAVGAAVGGLRRIGISVST
jgi:Immunity protein 10